MSLTNLNYFYLSLLHLLNAFAILILNFEGLSFSTPRGMTDLIFYCIVCQFISIVLAIIMWERSALRTEKNVIIRLLHPAVLRIAGARLFEITATIFIFGLFTAQYGKSIK